MTSKPSIGRLLLLPFRIVGLVVYAVFVTVVVIAMALCAVFSEAFRYRPKKMAPLSDDTLDFSPDLEAAMADEYVAWREQEARNIKEADFDKPYVVIQLANGSTPYLVRRDKEDYTYSNALCKEAYEDNEICKICQYGFLREFSEDTLYCYQGGCVFDKILLKE